MNKAAQLFPQPAGGKKEQRQNRYADQRQPPFHGKHYREYDNCLDETGEDVDEGVADRGLGTDDVVIEAAQ